MMVVLMRSDRPELSVAPGEDLKPEDWEKLSPGYCSYTGTYTVDEEEATVTHHVEACTNPNWPGGDRVREFERQGPNRIALRPRESEDEVELVWVRETVNSTLCR